MLFLRDDSLLFDAFHGGANNSAWLEAYRIAERATSSIVGKGNTVARSRLEQFLRDNVDIVTPNAKTDTFAQVIAYSDAMVAPLEHRVPPTLACLCNLF